MLKKIKNVLQYYSKMITSINTHLKNIENKQEQIQKIDEKMENYLDVINSKIKSSTQNTFSIVTACYNNANYINDYLMSIMNQNYDLDKIQVIIVDDGSTDDSKSIIFEWINKEILDLEYYYQDNSGQSTARNLGLKKIKNDWVTFIDMDDFVSLNYFSETNDAINHYGEEAQVYINKWVSFYEATNKKIDDHPLNYRFENIGAYKIYDLEEESDYFYLSASSSFFNSKKLNFFGTEFKNIKPIFEDANFIVTYLQNFIDNKVVYIGKTKYFYRKRKTKDSTIDLSRENKSRYLDALNSAYLKTFKQFNGNGIPLFVQKEILYDLHWNLRGFMHIKSNFSEEELIQRNKYLMEIFEYIDYEAVIDSYRITNFEFLSLVEYEFYALEKLPALEYVKEDLNTVTLKISGVEAVIENLKINGKGIENFAHSIKSSIDGVKTRYVEYILKIKDVSLKNISIYSNGEKLLIERINSSFTEKVFNQHAKLLFFDRADKADDNAEILYEWVMKNRPQYKNIKFALQRNSKDWDRLENKGFNLIEYGSSSFDDYYCEADYILTAGADDSIHNYKRYRFFWYKSNAKFIFLQHGVITDNLSNWLFAKRINQMVISTKFEYNDICKSHYSIFEDEIILSGLPRFDKLYDNKKNIILLQFTWRKQYENYTLAQMKQTSYYEKIVEILTNEKLLKYLINNNYQLHFVTHPNMVKYTSLFLKYQNDYVKVIDIRKKSYRELFAEGSIMITDYSSVFADFTYLNKPVIFYQFDKEDFYKNHTYTESLDYEKDGLGPVVKTYEDLEKEVLFLLNNNAEMSEKYANRRQDFFEFLDQNNSKRVFEALETKYGKSKV